MKSLGLWTVGWIRSMQLWPLFLFCFFSNIVTQPCCVIDEYSSTWAYVLIDVLRERWGTSCIPQDPAETDTHIIWFRFIAMTHTHIISSVTFRRTHMRTHTLPNVTPSFAVIKDNRRALSQIVTWLDLSLCCRVCVPVSLHKSVCVLRVSAAPACVLERGNYRRQRR